MWRKTECIWMEKAKMSREKEYKAKKEHMVGYKVSKVREMQKSMLMGEYEKNVFRVVVGEWRMKKSTMVVVGEHEKNLSRVRECMMGSGVRELVTKPGVGVSKNKS